MSGIKSEFPPFYGRDDPKAYLEWEKGMELVFDRKKYSELKKVREATFEFYGYANTWWHQLETCRRRNGKNPVKTWAEMKAVMRKHFVPCGYHQEQHYVDPFRKLEDLMLAYLQAGQQHLKKRNTKQKVEAKPPTEVAEFVEQSGQEEVQETKEAEVVIEPKEAEVVPIKNDVLDLRTNPFQEGGIDVIMESSEKTCVPCSAQTKSMINLSIPSATWSTFSPHLEHTSKLNQSNPSSGEEVIQLPSQVILSLRDSDIRAFNNYFQPNQKESSYETNYSGILNHQRIWENWKHNNSGSELGDMNFTSQWICFRPYCATEPKIMMHSPTQVRSQRKTNWRILLDLLGFQQAQEQKKWTSDYKVIAHFPKGVNLVLYLKNFKPSPIKSLQNYVWHPGASTKPK